MKSYWFFALMVHPISALRMLWTNRRQKPKPNIFVAIGRTLFQMDFKNHFYSKAYEQADEITGY